MQNLHPIIRNDLKVETTVTVGSKAAANIGYKDELDDFLSNKHVIIPTYSRQLYKLRKIRNSTIEIGELETRPDFEPFEYSEDTKTLTEVLDRFAQPNENGTRIIVKGYKIDWSIMWAIHGKGLMYDLAMAACEGGEKITFIHSDKFIEATSDFMRAIN